MFQWRFDLSEFATCAGAILCASRLSRFVTVPGGFGFYIRLAAPASILRGDIDLLREAQ